jgi:hypothetical protein
MRRAETAFQPCEIDDIAPCLPGIDLDCRTERLQTGDDPFRRRALAYRMRSKDYRLWTEGDRLSQSETDTDAMRGRFRGSVDNDWSSTLCWPQHQWGAVEFRAIEQGNPEGEMRNDETGDRHGSLLRGLAARRAPCSSFDNRTYVLSLQELEE